MIICMQVTLMSARMVVYCEFGYVSCYMCKIEVVNNALVLECFGLYQLVLPYSTYWHYNSQVEILSQMKHENLVNLIGYCAEENPFIRMLVFEYVPNGTVHDHLHSYGFFFKVFL